MLCLFKSKWDEQILILQFTFFLVAILLFLLKLILGGVSFMCSPATALYITDSTTRGLTGGENCKNEPLTSAAPVLPLHSSLLLRFPLFLLFFGSHLLISFSLFFLPCAHSHFSFSYCLLVSSILPILCPSFPPLPPLTSINFPSLSVLPPSPLTYFSSLPHTFSSFLTSLPVFFFFFLPLLLSHFPFSCLLVSSPLSTFSFSLLCLCVLFLSPSLFFHSLPFTLMLPFFPWSVLLSSSLFGLLSLLYSLLSFPRLLHSFSRLFPLTISFPCPSSFDLSLFCPSSPLLHPLHLHLQLTFSFYSLDLSSTHPSLPRGLFSTSLTSHRQRKRGRERSVCVCVCASERVREKERERER